MSKKKIAVVGVNLPVIERIKEINPDVEIVSLDKDIKQSGYFKADPEPIIIHNTYNEMFGFKPNPKKCKKNHEYEDKKENKGAGMILTVKVCRNCGKTI